ncbi:related to Chitin-binding protein [Melanopsichium pennsylvanicum]|uniref:Related to Chitin-binding protein n=2 Tax=Melanopsichium pennsylvanicum TaxID=63383 RepID=A0AAJ4XQQ3_9BASI|nr:related to Chitin-binding protein [Melanopsichium pennsylvanicum 4]SNX86734.1 related to Chitin-binding protein [Melanopsichium pennsylvanicum]
MACRVWSLIQLVALVATLSHILIGSVDAHGYVTSPASRAYLCKQGQAKNCGEIQYEPQSVEAPKGLPFARSGDGKLCSAGLSQFSELDRQGAKVWPTTKASDVHSFSWTFTAQHATTDFKYFITKPSWDSSLTKGLVASDFESVPFLVVSMNGKAPPQTMSHDLSKSMPARSGYQVVYAVWTVDNTANAFYHCIDLDFGGKSSSGGNSASTTSTGSYSGNTTASTSSGISSSSSNSGSTSNAAANTKSSSTGTDNNTSGNASSSADSNSGSSANTSTASSSTNSAAAVSTTNHRNHAACRRKKRRAAPQASILAARGDYRRQRMQLERKRMI